MSGRNDPVTAELLRRAAVYDPEMTLAEIAEDLALEDLSERCQRAADWEAENPS